MLKTIWSSDELAFGRNDGNSLVVKFGGYSKKLVKKSEKLSKSQILAKSRKNCQKIGNLSKFDTKKTRPDFPNFWY